MNLYDRNQKQRNFFNEKIDSYDQVHEKFMKTKAALADNLDKKPGKILDLGAGTGLELIHLFELFPEAKVTVIDITENMLAELSKREFASNIETICGDFFEVDFGRDYDAVISTSALHHFTPKEKQILYKKIFACLKSNGQFINCDKISMNQEEQDWCFNELNNNIDAYKHIDTPLTIVNEISILTEIGYSDIETKKVDRGDYCLFLSRKK